MNNQERKELSEKSDSIYRICRELYIYYDEVRNKRCAAFASQPAIRVASILEELRSINGNLERIADGIEKMTNEGAGT